MKISHLKAAARIALAATAGALVVGCVAPAPAGPQRTMPRFDYEPPAEATPASTNITFAVVGSEFETPVPLFERFSSNMAGDFVEILTARGFSIRGPFVTYDEMTFPDKENSNLLMYAEVAFHSDTSGLDLIPEATLAGVLSAVTGTNTDTRYRLRGTVRVDGRVTLVVAESLTNEKMWTKSVNIAPISVALEGTHVYPAAPSDLSQVLANEDQFFNDLGRELEGQYQEIMRRTFGYLDPREMTIVDRQADSLREKKVY